MNSNLLASTKSSQAGATMIEILIAILVFSVGLLGIASTQTLAITNTQSSLNKSYAVQYAYEVIDLIRANEVIASNTDTTVNPFGNYATIDSSRSANPSGYAVVAACQDASQGCTAAQMAQHELENWRTKIITLPDGQASITLSNTSVYTVLITWADVKNESEETGKAASVTLTNVAGENMAAAINVDQGFYTFQMSFTL